MAVDPAVEFWAEHQEDQPIFQENVPAVHEEVIEAYYGEDDGSEVGDSRVGDTFQTFNGASMDYCDNLVEEPKRLNASNSISYSRVAKKVDVKKLKSNIWKSAETIVEVFLFNRGKG